MHFRGMKGGDWEWCPLCSPETAAHTEGTAHEICFPDLTAPCPSSCLALLSPQVLLISLPLGAVLSPLDACSVRVYQIVGFFFFLTINHFKLYPTPIIKKLCCQRWGFLTFRFFPKLPCLFSNTKQANKQGLAITLHLVISAPVFNYGNTEWWRLFYIAGTPNKKQQQQKKGDMELGNGGGDLEKHLFEARTPQNSFM